MTAFLRDYVGKTAMQAQSISELSLNIRINRLQFAVRAAAFAATLFGLNALVDGLGLTLSVL
jgi:hypothetical protein